jgi:valyl-tRNA synthetase
MPKRSPVAHKRRRKSSITRLPAAQRKYIESLLREDRYTLDEMIAALRAKWPGEPAAAISRAALHRYQLPLRELIERQREIDTAARVVVEELGENTDERAGALLCQSITTLATNAALRAQTDTDIEIDDVRKLARAAKDTLDARSKSLQERQAIKKAAREELLAEQKEKLDALGKSGAINKTALAAFTAAIGLHYGQ